MNDLQVMKIMETHSGWRHLLMNDPNVIIDRAKEFNFENAGNQNDYLMLEEEFLRRLRLIVDRKFKIVNTRQAAAIERLRYQFEAAPTWGRKFVYSENTVRLQTKSGKLPRLTEEQQIKEFGSTQRLSYYYLEDVLKVPLGRWPYDARIIAKTPVEPKKEEDQTKLSKLQRRNPEPQKKRRKKKAKNLNRRLAAMQIKNEVELDVEIGGERKTVKIMMDTANPLEFGLVQIAHDDLNIYQIYVQSEAKRN